METEVNNNQETIKPSKVTEVTWEYVIKQMIDRTLFPKGLQSFRFRIFEERSKKVTQEMLNLFVYFKQRMLEDMDLELTRLHNMHVEINQEIKQAKWFWVKLRLKREAKDVIARMDGLKQATHMMQDTRLIPLGDKDKGDEKAK